MSAVGVVDDEVPEDPYVLLVAVGFVEDPMSGKCDC